MCAHKLWWTCRGRSSSIPEKKKKKRQTHMGWPLAFSLVNRDIASFSMITAKFSSLDRNQKCSQINRRGQGWELALHQLITDFKIHKDTAKLTFADTLKVLPDKWRGKHVLCWCYSWLFSGCRKNVFLQVNCHCKQLQQHKGMPIERPLWTSWTVMQKVVKGVEKI